MTRKKLFLFFLLVFLPLAVVLAGITKEGYSPLTVAPTEIRAAALDGTDSIDWTNPIDSAGADASIRETAGNPNIAISPRFSVTAATTDIRVGLWHRTAAGAFTFMGIASATSSSGGAQTDTSGLFIDDNVILIDSGGATHYEPRITDPSSGTVTLFTWTFGADSK